MPKSPADYLQEKGWPYKEHGNELWTNCPGCGEGEKDGSFSIEADTGTWNCKRGTCRGVGASLQTSGTLYQLKVAMGDVVEYSVQKAKNGVRASAPKKYEPPRPLVPNPEILDEAREYLKSRGLSLEIVNSFGVRPVVHPEGPAIAFPYFRNGIHVHTKYRLRDGKKETWKNFKADAGCKRVLYGADLIPAASTSLIIVEGEFDAIAMKCLGMPAVSMPDGIDSIDGWIDEEWDWLAKFKTIFLAVDMDVKSESIKKLSNRLGQDRCKRVILPLKDANACLLDGWGPIDLQKALNEAEDVKPSQLKSSEDYSDGYAQSRFAPDGKKEFEGTPWRLPGLNHELKGKRPGNLTILPGFNFAGKTTLMSQEMGDDCASGLKCLFFCLEMSPYEALDWLLQQQLRKKKEDITVQDYMGCQFVGFLQNLWWVDPQEMITAETILECSRYAVKRYGVQQIYLDNLTCIKGRKDDYNAQADLVRMCKFSICRDLDIHMTIVAHTRKSTGMGAVSGDRNDIAGAKELSDLADNVIIARRNEDEDEERRAAGPTTTLKIDKNRFGGTQAVINLKFNPDCRRFDPYTGPLPTKKNGSVVKRFGSGFRGPDRD